MVLDDSETLQNFPFPHSDMQVVCLSQTLRMITDVEVGDRVAVVMPSDERPIAWHHCLLQDKFSTMWARNVLCCEAFTIVEEDFSELLWSYLGMRSYRETFEKLGAAIMLAAQSQQYHIDSPLFASFGVFAEALVSLHDVEPENDLEKEELTKRIFLGKSLFMDVVQDGLTSLREGCEMEFVEISGEIKEAFEIMCSDDNFESTIPEWAAAAGTRATRNASSHPFSGLSSHEDRQTAISYFGSLIDGEYCKSFRNVALLGKLHLQRADLKKSTALKSKSPGLIKKLLVTISRK